MYTIIIVDNQEHSLKMIEKVVKDSYKEVEVIAKTFSGIEAIQLVTELQPDILIITVSLPEVSGLEVVRKVRSQNKRMRIIMDSIYDYFEFVKEALELDVTSYLLKPIVPSELIHALDKAILYLNEKKQYDENLIEKDAYVSRVREMVDCGFIFSILYNSRRADVISRYIENTDFPRTGYIMNIEIQTRYPERIPILKKNDRLVIRTIKEILVPYGNCIVGSRISKRILVLLGEMEKSMEELGQLVIMELKNRFDIDVLLGFGKEVKIENIHDSYEESVQCLRFQKEGKLVSISDVERLYSDYKEYYELEKKLLDVIRFGKEESLDLFSSILIYFHKLKPDDRKNKILELLVLAGYAARAESENETEFTDYINYCDELVTLGTNALDEWAFAKFEFILKAVRTCRSGRKSGTIKDALHYVSENWAEELSLEEIAQYVGLSPQHFSKIFKEETGSNYIDYLTKRRIDEAKKYLVEGQKTIKEICYLVGYHDPNYFSRLFKRTVGLSPTEYGKLAQPSKKKEKDA